MFVLVHFVNLCMFVCGAYVSCIFQIIIIVILSLSPFFFFFKIRVFSVRYHIIEL